MRISAVRYINTLPLIYGMRREPSVEISLDLPSSCYQKLVTGEVDVGLIPVFGTQLDSRIRAIKGIGIASVHRCSSVFLFATRPLDRVQKVLTDASSITSTTLVKILLKAKYDNVPVYESGVVSNVHEALRKYDAALIIGDQAILTEKTDYDHYDLATEWYSLTQLPFIFAVWAANRPLTEAEKEFFRSSCLQGLGALDEVIEDALSILPVSRDFLKRYYNESLHFQLTRSDYEGLLKYLVLAAEYGFSNRLRKDIWM